MTPEEVRRAIHFKTRRGFLTAGVAAATGAAAYQWLRTRPAEDGVPGPLRRVLNWNETVTRSFFQGSNQAREFSVTQAGEPRPNGRIGLSNKAEPGPWHLQLHGASGLPAGAEITMEDILRLPRTDVVTELHCIEGWSQVVHWAGVRFLDFAARYQPQASTQYVALATPDEEYYVGVDMESAMHPQTLLCYEMNSALLTAEHGAPLRLVIPTKYGIKNLKQIGTLRYTSARPSDYWAERGYDWYAGL